MPPIEEEVQEVEKVEDEKSEEKKVEKAEEKEEVEDDLSQEEQVNARQLFKALKNPETANSVISILAQKAGLLIKSGETKKEAVQTVTDVLKESLGEQYSFLADGIGKGIEKLLKNQEEKFKSQLTALQQEKLKDNFETAWDSLKGEIDDFEDMSPSIEKLIDEFPHNGKTSLKVYLKRLYNLAIQEKSEGKAVKRAIEKMQQGAKEGKKISSSGIDDSRVKEGSKFPSIEEAVQQAVDELSRQK